MAPRSQLQERKTPESAPTPKIHQNNKKQRRRQALSSKIAAEEVLLRQGAQPQQASMRCSIAD
eukprot:4963938-Amphidinium_carterae.1